MNGGGGADSFVFALFGDSLAPAVNTTGSTASSSASTGSISAASTPSPRPVPTTCSASSATRSFSGAAGELEYFYDSSLGVTVVQGDTNGDRVADFAIDLSGNVVLSTGDFVGVVAGSPPVVIEAFGSTQLTRIGSNYYLYSGGSGPSIKYGGIAVV